MFNDKVDCPFFDISIKSRKICTLPNDPLGNGDQVYFKKKTLFRYLWIFGYFPFIYLLGIGSIVLGVSQFIMPDVSQFPLYFFPVYIVLNIIEQQIRVVFIIVIIERLMATMFIESYAKIANSKLLVFLLIILTYFLTTAHTYFIFFVMKDKQLRYFVNVGIILFMHGFATVSCKFLQIKN